MVAIAAAFVVVSLAIISGLASINEGVWRFSVLAVLLLIAFLLDVIRRSPHS